MGGTLGIILRDETKFKNYNRYAWVYYFEPKFGGHHPGWVFIENLKRLSK